MDGGEGKAEIVRARARQKERQRARQREDKAERKHASETDGKRL